MTALLAPGLTATQVAALWAELGLTPADRRDVQALPSRCSASSATSRESLTGSGRCEPDVLDDLISTAEQRLRDLERSTTYDPGGAAYATAYENLTALKNIRIATDDTTNEGARFLISLDDDVVPPLAAISIGDLDTAKNVTWTVPGMATDTKGMTGWTMAAQNLYSEQGSSGPEERAVVSWVGYSTPPQPVIQGQLDFGVLGTKYAKDGSEKLATALRGLKAARGDDSFSNNIVAHSYGSTTAAYTLTKPDIHVDTFTTIGSAGLPDTVDNASDLHADHVYAGQAQNIWVFEPGRGDRWHKPEAELVTRPRSHRPRLRRDRLRDGRRPR